MPGDFFQFKQFRIQQDRCAMKVGTDAVLLGAWVKTDNSTNILDIGTGSGVIALMLAQRSLGAKITAIDIDEPAILQAAENINNSPFAEKIIVRHCSLQDLSKTSDRKYDLIVTNPPYFIDSLKSSDINRTKARHTETLTHLELIDGVKQLLDQKGRFSLILPRNEALLFRNSAESRGLYLSRLLKIYTTKHKEAEKRHLMQFEFRETEFSESSLVIEHEQHRHYTEEYKELTREFYIHF